jgi:hypothetical protein
MVAFLSVSHNSYVNRALPWIDRIIAGQRQGPPCSECGACPKFLDGALEVALEQNNASQWPDVLGCGAQAGLLTVSSSVLDAWRRDSIGEFPVHKVTIVPPVPANLDQGKQPNYFWVDGGKMLGARLDFEPSGFVIAKLCSTCGRRVEDIGQTYQRRYAGNSPTVLMPGSWSGANLFTTDLSPMEFFGTEAVLNSARKHHHTNFRFTPIEAGIASWSSGINYLGKRWPPTHPLRPSDGQALHEWVRQLKDSVRRYDARLALLDLGVSAAPAVPDLIRYLDDEDEAVRREAALLLSALRKSGVRVGTRGEAAAQQHEERIQKSLGR